MKKIFSFILVLFALNVSAQTAQIAESRQVQFGDDTWVQVPLQFPFPFYGKVFTNSFMFSNGAVAFMGIDMQPYDSYCCSGMPVNSQMPIAYNYTILPLQTDLLPVEQSRFYVHGDQTYQKYEWVNIAEYSNTNNLNTFSVEIKPSGFIGINYDLVNIQNQVVTSATVGDASKGEYNLHYHGQGLTLPNTTGLMSYIQYTSTGSVCTNNPLADPSCPGYAEAYFMQQCSANALYDSSCPGYAEAYFTQQCNANPLYAVTCPGYTEAYFTQQCSINALYDSGCPGYTEAYFAQQCQADGLYDSKCPNYAEAYAKKQLLNTPVTVTTQIQTTPTTSEVTVAPVIADATVNNVITPPATTSATSVSPASPVSVINAQPATQTVTQQAVAQSAPTTTQVATQQEQKQEQAKTEQKVASTVEKKMEPSAKSTGDMKAAVAKVQKEIAKESQEAKTIEAQVATQGLVVGSMNFVPGFDAYKNAIIPDTNAVLMARQYAKPVIDNQRAQRRLSGASESRWQNMVDSQYQLGK